MFVMVCDKFTPELTRLCTDLFSRLPSTTEDAVLAFTRSINFHKDRAYHSLVQKFGQIGKFVPFHAFSLFAARFPYLRDFSAKKLTPFIDKVGTLDWSNKYVPTVILFLYKLVYCDVALELARSAVSPEGFSPFFETFVNFCIEEFGSDLEEKVNEVLVRKMKDVISWISLSVTGNTVFKRAEGDLLNANLAMEQKVRRMVLYSGAEFAGLAEIDDWKILEWLRDHLATVESQAVFTACADFLQNLLGQWLAANERLRKAPILGEIFKVMTKYNSNINAFRCRFICAAFGEGDGFGEQVKASVDAQLWSILSNTPPNEAMLLGIITFLNGRAYVSEARSLKGEISREKNVSESTLAKVTKYVTDKIATFREDQRHLEIVLRRIAMANMDFCCEKLLPVLVRRDIMCFCHEALGMCLQSWLQESEREDLKNSAKDAVLAYCKRFVCSYESVKQIAVQLAFEEDDIVLNFEQWRKAIGMDDYADWPFVKEGDEKLTVQTNTMASLVPQFISVARYLADVKDVVECICSLVASGTRDVSELASDVLVNISPHHHDVVIEHLTANIYKNYMCPAPVFTWTYTLISVLNIVKENGLIISQRHIDRIIIICCICACSPYMDLRVLFVKLIDAIEGTPFADFFIEKEREISELALRNVLLSLSPSLKLDDHHFDVPMFRKIVSSAYTNLILFYLAAFGQVIAPLDSANMISTAITSLNQGLAALLLPIRTEVDDGLLSMIQSCFSKGIVGAGLTSCASLDITSILVSKQWTKPVDINAVVSVARLNGFPLVMPAMQVFCENVENFLFAFDVVSPDKAFNVDSARLLRFSHILYNYCQVCIRIFDSLITYQDSVSCYDQKPIPCTQDRGISSFVVWSSLASYESSERSTVAERRLADSMKQTFVKYLYMSGVPAEYESVFFEKIPMIAEQAPDLMTFLFLKYFKTSLLKKVRYEPTLFYGLASSFGDATSYMDRCLSKTFSDSSFSETIFDNFAVILSICFQYMLSESIQERHLAFNLMLSILFSTSLLFYPYSRVKSFIVELQSTFQSSILKETVFDLSEKIREFIPFYAEPFVRECLFYGESKYICGNDRARQTAMSMIKVASVWVDFALPIDSQGFGVLKGSCDGFRCFTFTDFFGAIMNIDTSVQLSLPLLEIIDNVLQEAQLLKMLLLCVFDMRFSMENSVCLISYALTVQEEQVMKIMAEFLTIESFNYICLKRGYSTWQKVCELVKSVADQSKFRESQDVFSFLCITTGCPSVPVEKSRLLQWALCCGSLPIATRAAEMLLKHDLDERDLQGVVKALYVVTKSLSSREGKMPNMAELGQFHGYIKSLIQLSTRYQIMDAKLVTILREYCICNQTVLVKVAFSSLITIARRSPTALASRSRMLAQIYFLCFDREILYLFFELLKAAAKTNVEFLGSEHLYAFMLVPLIWEKKDEILPDLESQVSTPILQSLKGLLDSKTDAKVAFQQFHQIHAPKLQEEECLALMSYLSVVVDLGNSLHASAAYYMGALLIQSALIPLESTLISRMFQPAVSCTDPILVDPIHFFLETVVLTNQGMVFKFSVREALAIKFPSVGNWLENTSTNDSVSFDDVERFPCLVLVNSVLSDTEFQKQLKDQLLKHSFNPHCEWSNWLHEADGMHRDDKKVFSLDDFKANNNNL